MSHRDKKLLYHFTPVHNLESICRRGLLPRAMLRSERSGFHDVADPDILLDRARHGLDRLVPFHFFARNPFDYRVTHTHPDTVFCYVTVSRSLAADSGWKIIPRHPLAGRERPQLLDWSAGIDAIDWRQLDRPDRDYNDQECKLACLAEALSPHVVTMDQVALIFVGDAAGMSLAWEQLDPAYRGKLKVIAGMFKRKQ